VSEVSRIELINLLSWFSLPDVPEHDRDALISNCTFELSIPAVKVVSRRPACLTGTCPVGQINGLAVQPLLQKYFCFRLTQIISLFRAVSCPLGGAYRDRHGRWVRDAVDAAVR
jgi:hypothetical protein